MENLKRALVPKYPEDIPKIRTALHPFLSVSDCEVGRLWELFSSDQCAQYLIVGDDTLRQFREWIDE